MVIKINYTSSDVYVSTSVSPVYVVVNYSGTSAGGPAVWGAIVGTLSDQTDLQTALDGKFDDPTGTTSEYLRGDGSIATFPAIPGGTVTSVGLTMPSAFAVANSPITSSGTLAVTGAGTAAQYVRGDGALATFPSTASGGASVNYYLNGSVNASVAGYKQMANTAVIGTGTNFTLTGNGLIAQFLTDVGNPNRLEIPGGAWNFEMYFQSSSNGGNEGFYVELLKYNGTTFTSIASSSTNPESITGGTSTDLYLTSLAVSTTALLATDRLAIRVYIVNNSGARTITLKTEDNNLCEIITTFAGGISALNGLTANTQYFATGTSGTDFAISSATDTHTFNLPTASATNRGALSSADWSTFSGKVGGSGATGQVAYWNGTNSQTGSNNLFWDAANSRLGIGTNSPAFRLDVRSNVNAVEGFAIANSNTATGAATSFQIGQTPTSASYNAMYITNFGSGWSSGGLANTNSITSGSGSTGGLNIVVDGLNAPLRLFTNDGSSSEKMRLDARGALGLRSTIPSTLSSSNAFAFIGQAGVISSATGANDIGINNNAYFNGTNAIYKNNGIANSIFLNSNGNIEFYNAPSGTAGNILTFTERLRIWNTTGNLALNPGANSDGGQRLQVYGDAFVRGSGNTGSTIALTVQDSAGLSLFRIFNNGNLRLGFNNILPFSTQTGSPNANGTNIAFLAQTTSQSATLGRFYFGGENQTQTSGNAVSIYSDEVFSPTGGTATKANILIASTINQTGGANGITRGLYVNPTLTAAADWRSIEWSNNSGWGLFGAGSAQNYLSGSLGIGTTDNIYKLDVAGDARFLKNQNGATTIRVENATSGTAAQADFRAYNSSGDFFSVGIYSATTTTYGALTARSAFNYSASPSGFVFMADTATGNIKFATGGNAEKMRLTAAGRLLLGTTTEGTQILQVQGTSLFRNATDYQLRISDGTYKWDLRAIANHTNCDLRFIDDSGVARVTMFNGYGMSIGNPTDGSSASLAITGIGSTSGSTSLLVKNSGSTAIFSVRNDIRVGIATNAPTAALDIWNATDSAQLRISDSRITIPDFSSVGFNPTITNRTLGFFAPWSSSTGGLQLAGLTSNTNTGTPFAFIGYHGGTSPTSAAIRFIGFKHDGGSNRTALTGSEIIAGFSAGTNADVFQVKANGRINMSSLPTSATGLSAGDLWNDAGTLKIV